MPHDTPGTLVFKWDVLYRSCRISTDKHVAQSLCHSRASCLNSDILLYRRSRRTSVPNFVKISELVAKMIRFFDFSRWRPSAVFYLFGANLDHPQRVCDGLYHYTKYGNNRNSSFGNMKVSIFGTNGWKTPIHALRIVVLGLFGPLNGVLQPTWTKPQKVYPGVRPHCWRYQT